MEEVPPGYYIEAATDTLNKCPNNVSGNGYFRQGWISYSLGIDSGNGTTVCTPCGEGILSRPKEFDEAEALMAAFKSANNQTLDDYQGLCPPGRTTLYIAGNGTFQNTIDDCLVIPGHGVFSSTAANPWNPITRSPSLSAQPCPLGFYSVGDATNGIQTQNPVCQKCAVNQFTLDVGSRSCDVCNAGFGIPVTSTSTNTSDCDTCLYGSYSFAGQSNLGDCVRSCPVDSCCVAQWEALNDAETVGNCRQVIMPPAAPDTTTAKLYYKLPPAGLIAAASMKNVSASSELQTGSGLKVSAASLQVAGKVDEQGRVVFDGSVGPTRSSPDAVKAKTISSGLYARCSVAQWASLAENGFMGTSPFPEDIEKDATYIQYNVQCNSEASCKQFCDSLSTCWGFVFVPGRGFAIRGGEDRLEVRTFFAVPDPNKPPGFNLSALQW
eukprot:gene6511-6738_t